VDILRRNEREDIMSTRPLVFRLPELHQDHGIGADGAPVYPH
jgi:hypothetical protein